jgi:hypothetical protein
VRSWINLPPYGLRHPDLCSQVVVLTMLAMMTKVVLVVEEYDDGIGKGSSEKPEKKEMN